jgi:hypothetical protein
MGVRALPAMMIGSVADIGQLSVAEKEVLFFEKKNQKTFARLLFGAAFRV